MWSKLLTSIGDKLVKYYSNTKSFEIHKNLLRAILRINSFCDSEDGKVHSNQLYAKNVEKYNVVFSSCLWTSAKLQIKSPDLKQNHDFYEDFVQCSLRYTQDSECFPTAIENNTQALKLKYTCDCNQFAMTVICSNLEDNHQNIYKLLLDLYGEIIKTLKEDLNDFVDIPVKTLSWYDRSKYYLLSK